MTPMNTNHHARQKCAFAGEVKKLKTPISEGSTNCSELGKVVLARIER